MASLPSSGALPPSPAISGRRRAVFLVHYIAILVVAELLIVFAGTIDQEWPALVALVLEIFLAFSLPVIGSFLVGDRPLAAFLGALTLPPLLRIVSIATPATFLTPSQWLGISSVPLILAAVAVMQAQGLRPRDVFLALGVRRYAALNIALVAAGFAIGFAEFQVVQPSPLVPTPESPEFPLALFAVVLTTGVTEEIIFRGVLLRTAVPVLRRAGAVAYVSAVNACLVIGFESVPVLLFVFASGLVFGAVVLVTESLWGAVGSHAIASIALYLILPFTV